MKLSFNDVHFIIITMDVLFFCIDNKKERQLSNRLSITTNLNSIFNTY